MHRSSYELKKYDAISRWLITATTYLASECLFYQLFVHTTIAFNLRSNNIAREIEIISHFWKAVMTSERVYYIASGTGSSRWRLFIVITLKKCKWQYIVHCMYVYIIKLAELPTLHLYAVIVKKIFLNIKTFNFNLFFYVDLLAKLSRKILAFYWNHLFLLLICVSHSKSVSLCSPDLEHVQVGVPWHFSEGRSSGLFAR